MKEINYRCLKCLTEISDLYKLDEEIPETMTCPGCGEEMIQFNFKNNKQRAYIFDPQK